MKRIWCLLFSLCLCVGVFIPALAANEGVGPYTISGVYGGRPFSLTFTAARESGKTVVTHQRGGYNDLPETFVQVPVTVLTLSPGSQVYVEREPFEEWGEDSEDYKPSVWPMWGSVVADGKYLVGMDSGPYDESVYSGRVEDIFFAYESEDSAVYMGDKNQYGCFVNTANEFDYDGTGTTYLLQLGDGSAPDGYRVFSVAYKNNERDTDYVITFDAAKTEKKTIMLREAWENFDDEDGTEPFSFSQYQSKEVTIVKVKPGSQLFFSGQTDSGFYNAIISQMGEFTEGNLYTTIGSGAVDYLWEGSIDRNFPSNEYASIYGNQAQYFWTLRDEKNLLYVIQLDTSSDFTDVSEYAYYTYPMIWAISRGITNGTTATTFSPNDPCTRAQILTFIWRYSGKPEPTVSNPFRDVSPDNYYYKAALWAYEKGMVSGTAFSGDTPCTRLAAVTYLWMLNGRPEVRFNGSDYAFTDLGYMEYPEGVAFAIAKGITQGTSETTFSPDRICTRAHIVTFLHRYEGSKDA